MKVTNPLNSRYSDLILPDNTFVAHMHAPEVVSDPKTVIRQCLESPIGSKSLREIARDKKAANAKATACITVSDNTRPVPYKGESGILLPVIEILMEEGFSSNEILVLVGTGMHRPMTDEELRFMIDPKVYELGITVTNHLPKDESRLVYAGTTSRGTKAMIDTLYMNADLKITTGLVESHFMAGASGGRKAICPGIIGEATTYIFHGPELMGDPESRDLNIDTNPVHQESLAVAKLAGCDFIVNVTLDHSFAITGVFAGDMEKAHLAAVEKIRETVEVPLPYEADLVITHAGYVGINHYQVAKCAVASLGALKKDGYLVSIADCTDGGHVIGSLNYRITLALLKIGGPEKFLKLLKSPDWIFLPEQWQVQMWARVFNKIDDDHFYFYAPQIKENWDKQIPGQSIRHLFDEGTDETAQNIYQVAVEKAISDVEKRTGKDRKDLKIIYIAEGPYEVPRVK